MKLALLTALTMTAFAANSVLNRAAVGSGSIDAASFALIRVIAGIVILCMVLSVRGTPLPLFRRARVLGAVSLAAYMAGFSLSYVVLDAGLGALILFGVVQITMFGWGPIAGLPPRHDRWRGRAWPLPVCCWCCGPDRAAAPTLRGR